MSLFEKYAEESKQIHKKTHVDRFIKLLSEENLTVLRGQYKTAWMEPQKRVIGIPHFVDDHNGVEMLMVGHEVAHALNTPREWYHISKKDGMTKAMMSCVNIVEDIRIEKIMKNKYLGFIKLFREGYEELLRREFFGDLNRRLQFGDKVNLLSKGGDLVKPIIKFSSRDYAAYKYIASPVTFEDVMPRAKFLYLYNQQQEIDLANGRPEDAEGEDGEGEEIDFDSLPDDVKDSLRKMMQDAQTKSWSEIAKMLEAREKEFETLEAAERNEKKMKGADKNHHELTWERDVKLSVPKLEGILQRKA